MSAYLVIKKGGVTLGTWCRSTEMYQAFKRAPWDEDKEFDPEEEFKYAKENINEKIDSYNNMIKKYQKMLEGKLDYEDRWDCITAIEECEKLIEELKTCLSDINFMYACYEDDKWEKDNTPKWTWSVG